MLGPFLFLIAVIWYLQGWLLIALILQVCTKWLRFIFMASFCEVNMNFTFTFSMSDYVHMLDSWDKKYHDNNICQESICFVLWLCVSLPACLSAYHLHNSINHNFFYYLLCSDRNKRKQTWTTYLETSWIILSFVFEWR